MRRAYPGLVIAAMSVLSAAVYSRLPDRIPVHWSLGGAVDRYGSRLQGALLLPFVTLGVWALMRWLPRIDPRHENYAKFTATYDLAIASVVSALAVVHLAVLGTALGWAISLPRVVPASIGVMVIVLGNVLPRARPNWWFGIRTPWTLSSDQVWARTHRVGGYLLVAAGLVMLLSAPLPGTWGAITGITALCAASFAAVAYSYFAWRKEQHQ
jgi:immunity protein, SdpI family